jgi:hypothetical protein
LRVYAANLITTVHDFLQDGYYKVVIAWIFKK